MRSQERGLLGRQGECDVLDRLPADARLGRSRVLVVRGEAGIGKTALLDVLAARAPGCRVVRAAGVESERELAYAALHQVCAAFLDRIDRLPDPQRDALGTALGLRPGSPPDRFLVGSAVLTLLAEVADEQPLVCLVDDAQWLDQVSAQALAFAARRLLAERIVMVFAVREPGRTELAGLPDLVVRGLGERDAHTLLDSVVKGPVDHRVRDRIVAETHGNPLALIELPLAWTAAELAEGLGRPDPAPLAGRIEQGFLRQLEPLPAPTRLLLLLAAAEPLGDVTLLWRAAGLLGLGADTAAAAGSTGLIEFGARIRFRHPLVRSAVYRSAPAADRHAVHRALAEVTDPAADPDRRPRPPGLAPRPRHRRPRRGRRRRPRAVGAAGAGARRCGRRGGLPRARGAAHPRARAARPARARRGPGHAGRRRARRGARAAGRGRRRAC